MNPLPEAEVRNWAGAAPGRMKLWSSFLQQQHVKTMAEVGVFQGRFAARMLTGAPALERYYMIDPWRNLEDWDKPLNRSDDAFNEVYDQAMASTEQFAAKRVVLRGRTVEVVDQIPDGSLDLAYLDGDHTLRGITIDLARIYPKVRDGGFIAGDDFCRNIFFQHEEASEPTLVFPYAVHFAEAMGVRIYALPFRQFLLQKAPVDGEVFIDLAGGYVDTTLLRQLSRKDEQPKKRRKARRGEE
jgi:hypothetical protein